MTTILAPTDFSATSKNAALFAIQFAKEVGAQKVIIYNAYQSPPVITEPAAMPALPLINVETLKNISEDSLHEFTMSLQEESETSVELVELSEYAIFSEDVNDVCERVGADIIVMGITGTSMLEEVFIGSTALNVVKHTKIPVIIVPAFAAYRPIKDVVLACDLKKVEATTPVEPIKTLLNITHAQLHVLHIAESNTSLSAQQEQQKTLLQQMLQNMHPKFHLLEHANFIEGVNEFADTNHIDLIIAIPKKHGFFESFFSGHHTKKLAFHSHVPLMYLHEEEL